MKQFITKLKRWLHFNNFFGNCHFIVIFLVLIFVLINADVVNKIIIGIITIIFFVYVFIKHKPLALVMVSIAMLIVSIFLTKVIIYNKRPLTINNKMIVREVTQNNDYQKIILDDGVTKYIYYNMLNSNDIMHVGDIYNVSGNVVKQQLANTPNGFNYAKYLKYQNIVGILEIDQKAYINNIFIFNKINNWIEQYYDNNFEHSDVIKALVIGKKNGLDEDLKSNVQSIGISHLFVVSGLHVGMLTSLLSLFLKKIKTPCKITNTIIFIFLGGYLIVTNFMVSVIRVSLAYLLKHILKRDFTPLDMISINMLLVLVINPFYIYSYSFILTYLISSMIIIIRPLLLKKKSIIAYLVNMIIISFASIVITLPIVVNLNSTINLLSILYNIIYIPFVSYILLPLSVILTFLPFLENIFSFLYFFFIWSINLFSNFDYLSFSFPVLNSLGNVIYYCLLLVIIYMCENKKWYFVSLFIVYLFGWYNKAYFELNDKVVFLDVAEGDATHIKTSFNQYNIIIDTGINNDDTIISYLQKEGIRTIDLVIISHGDSDHNGNLEGLLNDFKVKYVMLSKYDYKTYQILTKNNYNNYCLVERGDVFKLGKMSFDILWPNQDTNDINNNSLVFKMNYDDTLFLFTGDIEKEVEEKIIDLEDHIDIDVLKIAHHASNTSTHSKWLDNVKFKVGVAMTGDKNPFGFPNKYTVKRLEKYEVYYTSECDSIIFSKVFYKKKWQIKAQRDK